MYSFDQSTLLSKIMLLDNMINTLYVILVYYSYLSYDLSFLEVQQGQYKAEFHPISNKKLRWRITSEE